MKSEFKYFMSLEDHVAFDEHIRSLPDICLEHRELYDEIIVSDGFIQYQRSKLINGVLTAGRIAIATTDLSGEYSFASYQEVETVYQKLRNWLKKRSINTLVCFKENMGENSTQPINNFWLCEGAEALVKGQGVRLKEFDSAYVAFKLA